VQVTPGQEAVHLKVPKEKIQTSKEARAPGTLHPRKDSRILVIEEGGPHLGGTEFPKRDQADLTDQPDQRERDPLAMTHHARREIHRGQDRIMIEVTQIVIEVTKIVIEVTKIVIEVTSTRDQGTIMMIIEHHLDIHHHGNLDIPTKPTVTSPNSPVLTGIDSRFLIRFQLDPTGILIATIRTNLEKMMTVKEAVELSRVLLYPRPPKGKKPRNTPNHLPLKTSQAVAREPQRSPRKPLMLPVPQPLKVTSPQGRSHHMPRNQQPRKSPAPLHSLVLSH